jgi:plastocyanin
MDPVNVGTKQAYGSSRTRSTLDMPAIPKENRMPRKRLIVVAILAAAALAAGTAFAAVPKASGTVGPGFTISLKQGGKKVTQLAPGRVSITVTDRSSGHNFHLTGPGVNKATSVARTGTVTWNLTLKKGVYRFVCDPHRSSMKGSFTVR